MKTSLFLIFLSTLFVLKLSGQDTSKVQITFQTNSSVSIPLFKQIYLGEINSSGWDGRHFVEQHGSLTRDEFLLNAPGNVYFGKNKPVVVVMKDEKSYKLNFMVYPGSKNQKWLLTPPGVDYTKSRVECFVGGGGLLLSTFLLISSISLYAIERNSYNGEMAVYIAGKNSPNNIFSRPKSPNAVAYFILPAITYSVSIPLFIHGRKLYKMNKPRVEQIE